MFSEQGYRAARNGAAVAIREDLGLLRVSGADAAVWLQGLVTNDVAALAPGGWCYAAYLTPQGRMITDARVVRPASAPDTLVLEVPRSRADALQARLDGLVFAEDVKVVSAGHSMVVLEVVGPDAPRAETTLEALDAGTSPPVVFRDDGYGVPALVVHVASTAREAAVEALVAGGAVPIDDETLDVVRVEAGRPRFLVDMGEDTIPLEAGIEDRAISFTKGCYVGQEVIVRVTQRGGGRVKQRLVGLAFGADVEREAAPGFRGETIRAADREVGRVTSAAWSPTLSRVIALGYVHRDFLAPGTGVVVAGTPASVAALPFVS